MGGNYSKDSIHPDISKIEIQILKKLELCPLNIKEDIKNENKDILLDRINEFRIKDDLDERFFDHRLMNVISCLYGNFWVIDHNLFKATDFTKDYFRVTRNMSTGVEGSVLLAEKGGSGLKFVIKTQINPRTSSIAIHEAFVGLTSLNKLRAYCPNFAFVYGGFICGTPDIINGKICDGNIDVPYIIYENIEGLSLRKYMSGSYDPGEVIAAVLQIYFALRIAKEKGNDFAHRDPHGDNIIMRPLKQKMALRYEYLENGKTKIYYIYTSFVATLIDYGFSEVYIPVDGKLTRFGETKFKDAEANGKPIAHIRDLNKLLGFTTNSIKINDDRTKLFKTLMGNLYIGVLKPYKELDKLGGILLPEEIFKIIEYDRLDYFNTTTRQAQGVENGTIDFDKLIQYFNFMFPIDAINAILLDASEKTKEDESKLKLLFPVLKCNEKCLDQCATFANIMLTDPEGEAESAAKSSPALLYASLEIENSFRHLASQKWKEEGDYAAILKEKLLALAKKNSPAHRAAADQIILGRLSILDKWLTNPVIFSSAKITQVSVNNPTDDIFYYRDRLNILGDYIRYMKEIIYLSNALTLLTTPSIYKSRIINAVNRFVKVFTTNILPLKRQLRQKALTSYFGDKTNEFIVRVLNQFPEKVIFPPLT